MKKTRNLEIAYLLIYCAIFIVTIYFAIFAISNYITQKKEYELFKQSWQYVADTNIELKTDTNEDGTTETYYAISTPEQLAGMFEVVNSNSVNAESINTYTYKLTQNIDLSGKTWSIVNFYKGYVFDGNSFHIQNLNISSSSTNVGFVGVLYGTIQNLYFDNATIKNTNNTGAANKTGVVAGRVSGGEIINVTVDSNSSVTGNYYLNNNDRCAGGIAGYISSGKIINCINYASVGTAKFVGGIVGEIDSGTIENCTNYSSILNAGSNEYPRVGGIVGESYGSISYCSNLGNVTYSVYATGDFRVGGIVGHNGGNLSLCVNKGSIYGTNTSTAIAYAGGIAGYSNEKIENCLNTGSISAYSAKLSSSSSQNVVTKSVSETEYYKNTYFFWGWATEWFWYTRNSASITITNIDAYAGGIVGVGNAEVSNCYNSGQITGGYKKISVSITETLKKDAKYLSVAGGNPVSRSHTSTFDVFTMIGTGAINGGDSTTKQSICKNDCLKFQNGESYINSGGLIYYQSVGSWAFMSEMGGTSYGSKTSDEFDVIEIAKNECNTSSQTAGKVVQRVTMTDYSYTVKTYAKSKKNDEDWANGNVDTTMLEITNVNTKLVKNKNVTFVSSFDESYLSTLGTSNWFIQDGEPMLKDFYWLK